VSALLHVMMSVIKRFFWSCGLDLCHDLVLGSPVTLLSDT
jgi:hypothetical protein